MQQKQDAAEPQIKGKGSTAESRWLMQGGNSDYPLLSAPKISGGDLSLGERGIICAKKNVTSTIWILYLDPGLLIGRYLRKASMPEETKHPAILSKDQSISKLVLQHNHRPVGHAECNHMLYVLLTSVGVVYFGPTEVKRGRNLVMRYGVGFTCMAGHAVHFQVASSLYTDSCINAIQRFKSPTSGRTVGPILLELKEKWG